MFGLFRRNSSQDGSKPSLDDVQFDTAGFSPQGEPEPGRERVWHSAEGDGVGLYLFPAPPDLPCDSTVDELSGFCRARIGGSGTRLLELGIVAAGGYSTIRI